MVLATVLQVVGLVAIFFAARQLAEARRKRHFDTYWQFFTMYSSPDFRDGREALRTIGEAIGVRTEVLENAGLDSTAEETVVEEWAHTYLREFHHSRQRLRTEQEDAAAQLIDQRARARVRFLNTAGALIRRGLVDEDLLLSLVGPAFDRDYLVIRVVVTGNRLSHSFSVYPDVEVLKEHYDRWATPHDDRRARTRLSIVRPGATHRRC